MSNNKLVSIITPCFNGEFLIHRLLDSILNQTYNNIEFIFINDGSTDKTEEVVKSYMPKFELAGIPFIYVYQQNEGQAAALNRGLKIFQGEYLMWPDSDDYLSEIAIEERVQFLENNQDYGFVRTNGVYVEDYSLRYLRRISNEENRFSADIFEDLFMERTYCACGCYMVRTSAFLDVNPGRTIFISRGGQNWQMELPIAYKYKCGFMDDDHYFILERKDSHSRQPRNKEEMYGRCNELEIIITSTILSINMSEEKKRYYLHMAKSHFVLAMLNIAFLYSDKNSFRKYYTEIKKEDNLNLNLKFKLQIVNMPFLYKLIPLYDKLILHVINFLPRYFQKKK